MDADVSTHTFLTMIIEKSVCVWTIFFVCAIILMWYTRNIFLLASDIFFINWTVLMSDNLPQRVQILGHAHIISCQIFGDLLLKSAFERIFNVMQLILVEIKWHIMWKYLIQKFHDIRLSYYFNIQLNVHFYIFFSDHHIQLWIFSRWHLMNIFIKERNFFCRLNCKHRSKTTHECKFFLTITVLFESEFK
jgi:hypothetical protein